MQIELQAFSKEMLCLIDEIAKRHEPGHAIARGCGKAIRNAIAIDNDQGVKDGITEFVAGVIMSPKHYASQDDYIKAAGIMDRYAEFRDLIPKMDAMAQLMEKDQKKQRLTTELLEAYFDENGIKLRRNAITHQVEHIGWNDDGALPKEREEEHFPTMLEDELGEKYTAANKDNIRDRIALIADKNLYNPFIELLDAETWDKVDRLPELWEVLGIPGDPFACLLVEKWMRQVVALQYNGVDDSFGGEGVLVLCGAQGCGKSEFARRISNIDGKGRYFLPGAILDPKDKDSLMQCTSRLIVELGELGSTFKSDIGRLKAFITSPSDTYRVPYGKAETTTPRHTSFIATVDRLDFLVDDSGNRRWLVVEVDKIDLDRLDKIDLLQLWRQVKADTVTGKKDDMQSFRLTAAERNELNKRNVNHERLLPGEQELRDILAQYYRGLDTDHKFEGDAKQSGSQIIKEYAELSKYSAQQIGKALTKIGVEHGITSGTTWYLFPRLRKIRSTILPASNG